MENYLEFLVGKYELSGEFEKCIQNILLKSEEAIFKQLSKYIFVINGGELKDEIIKVFELLNLCIVITDILDDIEDNHTIKWNEDEATLLNASTALISILVLELNSSVIPNNEKITTLFMRYLLKATDGQHSDLTNRIFTEEECIKVIQAKSGSLVALACITGEILATGSYRTGLEQCALSIGVIAQLNNDFEDLLLEQKDIQAKKITLPILYLLKYQGALTKDLLHYYEGNNLEPVHISKEMIEATGLDTYMAYMQTFYRQRAISLFSKLYPQQNINNFLKFIL